MAVARFCGNCGALIPADAPEGCCPQCAVRIALGSDSSPGCIVNGPVDTAPHPGSPARPSVPTVPGPEATQPLPHPGSTGERGHPGAVMMPLRPGIRFGDYEILEEIGRGGMGIVYKARQSSLNRVVALKMVASGVLATETGVKRFNVEAETAAALNHPNIVPIYEVGNCHGQLFFSMQYVEGRSLAELQLQREITHSEAVDYMIQVADALSYAHHHDVLHRDLKPHNVLIDGLGKARIMDYGLAKHMNAEDGITLSGQVVGTPSYMPPEQALGKEAGVQAASDIFSAGAVLYQLLSGRPPFLADTLMGTLMQVRECDPIPPRVFNPRVPRELEMICLKCMEKDPRNRYPTAQHLADDLQRFRRGEAISIRSPGPLDLLIRTLERGHHDVELRTWGRILSCFAFIVVAAHLAMFALTRTPPPYPLLPLLAIRVAEFTAMAVVFFFYRHDWYPPRGLPARQLWALWLAFVVGSTVLGAIGRFSPVAAVPYNDLVLYPQMAVFASLGFFIMGSSYWGYCYVVGLAFMVLAPVMLMNLSWAPIVYGLTWAASFLALSSRLRKLAREA